MKRLSAFLSVSLIASSGFAASVSWEASVLKKYSRAQSYKELFCSDKQRSDLCVYYTFELGEHISEKPAAISLQSADTLLVEIPGSQVRLTHEAGTTRYTINSRRLDLKNANSLADLRSMIENSLPKKSALNSFWISSAVAQSPVGKVDPRVVASIEALVVETQSVNSCKSLREFVMSCVDKDGKIDKSLIQSSKAWKEGSFKDKERQAEVAKVYIQKLDVLADRIEQNVVPFQSANVQVCAMRDPQLEEHFAACKDMADTYRKVLSLLNLRMDLQRANAAIDAAAGKAASTPQAIPIPAARPRSQGGTQ